MSNNMAARIQSSIPQKPGGFPAPLSLAQRRLWFIFNLNPSSALYNISRAWRLKGPLNTSALEISLQTILYRHEALRTVVQEIDGQAVQIITPPPIKIVTDWNFSSTLPSKLDAEIDRFLVQERNRPFDLRQGPLFRFHLIRCGQEDHVFLFTVHHIVFDGWSLEKFSQELSAAYEQILNKQEISLPPLSIQYGDFSYWQQQYVTSDRFASDESYWKSQLRGAPDFLDLPTDYPRREISLGCEGHHDFFITTSTLANLKELSQSEGGTLFMTLLGAFQILLARYSGTQDIVVGTPIANRNRIELEDLMGFFVNLLPLRSNLSGVRSFRVVLAQVRRICLEAYRHNELPFEHFVETLNPLRDLSRHPVVQVIFQLRKTKETQLHLPALSVYPFSIKQRTGNFDLHLVCEEVDSKLQASLYYPTDLFSETTMARMATHYQTLLENLVADPERDIWQLPIPTKTESHQVLEEWNNTQHEYPGTTCLHELFEVQVKKTPDAIAVWHNDCALSYLVLNRRANQLAHHLRSLGIGPEVVVAIAMERSLNLIIGLLGILKTGAAYLPLEINYPRERLAFMLKNSKASLLLTQRHLRPQLPIEGITPFCLDTDWEGFAQGNGRNPKSGALPENLAYVIYTSGSTGRPKGVLVPHRGLVNYLTWAAKAYAVEEGTETIVHSSIGFDLTITSLFSPLLVGGSVRLLDESGGLEEMAATLLSHSGSSLLKMTPSHLEGINQLVTPEEVSRKIRTLILGGETLSAKTLAGWNHHTPGPKIVNEYGPTETVVGCCVYEVPQRNSYLRAVPIGRPISNMHIYLLDQNLQLVPIGVAGEVYIGGVGLARGYQGRPDLTAEQFIPHPYSRGPDARLYKTGDLGRYFPDGNIEFLGRIDGQVKIRGYRIEPEEVQTILGQHPDIRVTVVICQEDSAGGKYLAAYVVPAAENTLDPATLRQYLQTQLPDYMLPAAFILMDTLPLTPNGKVNRQALPMPDQTHRGRTNASVPPKTPLEEMLIEIWQDLLKMHHIGVQDNFFALGGHSLLATQVMARLRNILGLALPLRTLFEHQTVAKLASKIERELATAFPNLDQNKSPS